MLVVRVYLIVADYIVACGVLQIHHPRAVGVFPIVTTKRISVQFIPIIGVIVRVVQLIALNHQVVRSRPVPGMVRINGGLVVHPEISGVGLVRHLVAVGIGIRAVVAGAPLAYVAILDDDMVALPEDVDAVPVGVLDGEVAQDHIIGVDHDPVIGAAGQIDDCPGPIVHDIAVGGARGGDVELGAAVPDVDRGGHREILVHRPHRQGALLGAAFYLQGNLVIGVGRQVHDTAPVVPFVQVGDSYGVVAHGQALVPLLGAGHPVLHQHVFVGRPRRR